MACEDLVFAVNGEKFEVLSVNPSTTLLEFLRSNTCFKSVKLSCGEGGCGACIVILSKYDPVLDQVEEYSINSCLTLLCSINGCSITTSEGLGNTEKGFHPIHKRFAGFHASQCGFCTPGMCISLYSALSNAHNSKSSQSSPDCLTALAAEKSIAGNLCRCTGYRPIADACKSFAADVDIEDLGFNSFWRKGESREEMFKKLPPYNPDKDLVTFPDFLKEKIKCQHNVLDQTRYHWITPVSVAELQEILATTNPGGDRGLLKLVVGNTGTGYYKEEKQYARYIDISHIPEMSMIKKDDRGIEIGAVVTISKVIDALMEENSSAYVFKKIGVHMEKVANHFIRNSGSIGGNLVMAQSKNFPSDITTLLLAADASVYMINAGRHEKLRMGEYLVAPPILDTKTVLLKVHIPSWIASSTTGLLFETYRAALRPIGSALPYINAAFLAVVSRDASSRGIIVDKCRLAFGSYGGYHSIRAREVEDFLTGKILSHSVLYEAVRLLKGIIVPSIETSYPEYKKSLAVGFLFDFLYPLIESGCWDSERKHIDGHVDPTICPPLLSSAQQVFESKKYHPVGEAIIKFGAEMQASGEAVYVDDIPSLPHCLHGAFIYSTKPLARIKKVGFGGNVAPLGVLAVITFKDIPQLGQNVGYISMFGTGLLFADEVTIYAGQIIALVVADTQKHADMAANLAVVEYDSKNIGTPVLSVEDAVKRSSLFEVPPKYHPEPVGDVSKGMAEADRKIRSVELRLGSQYFFYMETQTTLALPDEDNCLVVYSSTQAPEYTQSVIATCLGIPEHNVRVITRRVGGGFGGKAIKSMPVATACALAAQKLQRPVKIYLNRKTDMIMTGGRHPMKITYSVGFRCDGKVTALELCILIDAGIDADVSPILPLNIMNSLRKYDWGALSFDIKVCKTNLPSRTSLRAPGEVQGSYIAESIIENLASSLNMDVDVVRRINLHTYESLRKFYKQDAGEPDEYTLPLLWDKLEISADFRRRAESVKEFNLCNVWRKRGISRVPIIHLVVHRPTPGKVSILSDGSVAVEVAGIEVGQGLWTKVQQMVAYGLGMIKCDGSEDLLERIRLLQTDTLSMSQSSYTAGSTTSENCCEAVRLCCGILVERLKPTMNQILENARSVTWDMLIQQAYAQSVDLSARTFYKPESSSAEYLNYGVGASEVEVDLVTGRTEIIRSDIIYDCGKSLNPAVDLGQIEGAFVQGIGFFMYEEYTTDENGLVNEEGTWDYKIPTIDTIPKQFNVQILNSGHHKNRILSSKASGEPPLLVAASVHCATRSAIREARKQYLSWNCSDGDHRRDISDIGFELPVPAIMPVVKQLCGLESVEKYLEWKTYP
ncbi:PREDICTED: benzaldehyde dehydrogenase (NAD(+))-like [Camelina sativa]|uniref:Benzaldehyde dehydrogenase (NAD(+))-like n=1 Tax=Camelina sativa TaxID=90675 RepID=A0ABM0XCP0_CAMSA|nr:PREDICTED: benzaldehyde dehydrogenase (NAD(+))-like [Camelina sativa]